MEQSTVSDMVDTLEEMYKKLYTMSLEASDDWVKAYATEMRADARWLREKLEKHLINISTIAVAGPMRPHVEL